MARSVFPQDRLVYRIGSVGSALYSAATTQVTVYADSACTVLADIQDLSGVTIAGATVTIDSTSQIPRFMGPDGSTTLWVRGADGPTAMHAEGTGSVGAAGPAGPAGATGPAGPQPPLGAAGAGSTIALVSTDPSTTNARTPLAHASSHASNGSDPVTPAAIGADPAGAASAAQSAAISAAAADATTKANSAQAAAISTAASDATTKANAAQSAAISAAASDATTKANGAQSAAISTAAADATAKANSAQSAAVAAIPSAATTVATATAYGLTSAAGTSAAYARQDHTHGTPDLTSTAPATTEGIATAAAVGTASAPARADHVHPMAAAGAPAASAVTSTQATGVAATFAASDHVHAREGFGAVAAQTAFGAASANGTAATVPRSDHAHGTPTLPTASVSVAGVVQLDGTATDIAALGTQAAGAIGKAADAGHVHPTTGLLLLAGGIMTGALTLAGDPTSASHATRMAWVEEQNGWGLGDYIAAGSPIKAWTGTPGSSISGAFTFGQIKMNKLWLRNVGTLSTVTIFVTTAGVGLTSGQNFVAILDASGNQLAISADQTTAWASTGAKPAAMTVPVANAPVGGYYVAVVCNGATTPIQVTMHANANTSALNFGLTAANGRCLNSAGSANTTIPASIALGSQTLAASNFMAVIT